MNFSEAFKQSNQLCKLSPDGDHLANATQYRLVIRDVSNLQIKALFTCLDSINYFEWSSDSQYLLCALYKRGLIQVWSLENTEWTCKIDHGSMGLTSALWAPDGRHILSTSDFKLRITVWSLINKSVSYIKYLKHSNKGLAFTRDGQFMALLERRNYKDFISVFACDGWEMLKHFATDTKDASDLGFSPNGCIIAVWDTKLEYKVNAYTLDGRFISSYSAYDFALGIKYVCWTPSNQFLAIGSYDQQVRLINNVTWKAVCDLKHPLKITNSQVIIYQEMERKQVLLPWENVSATTKTSSPSHYLLQEKPFAVPFTRPDPEKPNPKLGVGTILFSHDNKFMVTKNDNMPCVAWIWDIMKLKLHTILVQAHPIRVMCWDSRETRLALCCATNKIYMWSLAGALAVEVPCDADFFVINLQWHHSGSCLVLMSKLRMCMCYLSAPA